MLSTVNPLIYLNNAATSFPKPRSVLEAHAAYLSSPPGSPDRSTGKGGSVFENCRKNLARLLDIYHSERIYFTRGATDSANFLLSGLEIQSKKIIVTATEHNSLLRPLYNNPVFKRNTLEIIPCDSSGRIEPEDIRNAVIPGKSLVVVNHCSNVTGAIQDIESIGRICHNTGALLLVDISQSAGCLPIKVDKWGIDILIFTGHKNLLGTQGTGGFYIRPEISFETKKLGGTGSDGLRLSYQRGEAPFEVGTQNKAGIDALNAGIDRIAPKKNKLLKWPSKR